jgi:hypothetical protein
LIQCFLENAGMRRLLHSERKKKESNRKVNRKTAREEKKNNEQSDCEMQARK